MPPVACRQSVREFSGQTGGFTASHPPLTSIEPEHWWPQLLHWALRVAAVLFGKLLTMADTEGGNDGYHNMVSFLKDAGVKTSWSRTEHKESGKIHHTVSMGGDSLYILLEEWHKENGFTKVFDKDVGDNVRAALLRVSDVVYVMSSRGTTSEYWAALAIDCFALGQELVAVFGKSVVSPTVHEMLTHGADKLFQLRALEDQLGMSELPPNRRLSLRSGAEWGFEEGNKLLRDTLAHSSRGGQLAMKAKGKSVTIIGMNDNSAERHARLSGPLSGAH